VRTKRGLGNTGYGWLAAGILVLGLAVLAGCAADYSTGGAGPTGPTTTLNWTFDTNPGPPSAAVGAIYSTAAREIVFPFRLFFGSNDWNVYCLDSATGAHLWHRKLGGPITASPCLVGAVLYVGCQDGYLYALNTADGTDFFIPFKSNGKIYSSPAFDPIFGQVIFGTWLPIGTGSVYAVNANTGGMNWRTDFPKPVVSSPAVYAHPPFRVTFGCLDNKIYCLNTSSGSDAWGAGEPTGAPIYSSPILGPGPFNALTIFIGSNDHFLYAVGGMAGGAPSTYWKFDTGGDVKYATPVQGAIGQVYIGSEAGKIHCVNQATGALDWSYAVGGALQTAAVGAKYVYVGSTNGSLVAVDPKMKALGWKYITGSAIVQPGPIMSGNLVYIGTKGGKMLALDETDVAGCAPTGIWPLFRFADTREQGWLLPKPPAAVAAPAPAAPVYQVPGSEFSSIQEAIDGAPDGSRLLVAPGEYHENISFRGKGLTVESADGPQQTILDGPDVTMPTVSFAGSEGPDAVLRGFTVTGGRVGLSVRGAAPTLTDNLILSGVEADSPMLAPRLKADQLGRRVLGGAAVSGATLEPLALWLLGSPTGVLASFVEKAGIPTGRPVAMPVTALPPMAAALPTAGTHAGRGWMVSLAVLLGVLLLVLACLETARRLHARKC
jgi:outer membrane protein assembly factor BamB